MLRILLFSLAVAGALALDFVNQDLTVTNVERSIDLVSHLVKINEKLTFSNGGKVAAKNFHYVIANSVVGNVALFQATVGYSGKTYLTVTDVKIQEKPTLKAFKINLKDPLQPGGSVSVDVEVIVSKGVTLYPEAITQKENQLVWYAGNHYSFLPYKSKKQTTKVILPNNNVESYSKLKPVSLADSDITYGPYSEIEAFSENKMTVHFQNNNPFCIISKLERTIEISMWGNIAVEEIVDIRHTGAKLKGPFSRLDYQRENAGLSSIEKFKTILPASASDVYYRDDIGNISTSAMREMRDAVELMLKPRFPLFGGWKTHYFLGYNVPSYEYLFTKDQQDFILKMRLLDHVFDDMLVEEMVLRIILPEGSTVGNFIQPFPVKREPDTLHFTYLDTSGRPVVTVRNIGDLTEKHIEDFQLEFQFPKLWLVREPLILIATFLTFFALAIIYVRLDFAITKDYGAEAKLKIASYCQKVVEYQKKRIAHYEQFDEALVKLKASKDVAAFKETNNKILIGHKAETAAIADLGNLLKTAAPDLGEKTALLQNEDRCHLELQSRQAAIVEKLVTGNIDKSQFIDQERTILSKKRECWGTMYGILNQFRSVY